MRCLLSLFFALPLLATLDQYGGSDTQRCLGGAQAHFYVEQIGNDIWWCTPAGNVFWEVGIYDAILPDSRSGKNGLILAKYSDNTLIWGLNAIRRLRAWGFNALDSGAYSYLKPFSGNSAWNALGSTDSYIPAAYRMPAIHSFQATANALQGKQIGNNRTVFVKDVQAGIKSTIYTGWRAATISDYYDAAWTTWLTQLWTLSPPPSTHTDYMLAVMIDDADFLWWVRRHPDYPGVNPAVDYFCTPAGWAALVGSPLQAAGYNAYTLQNVVYADTEVHTKTALLAFLQGLYATIGDLNTAWGSSYTQWESTGTVVTGEALGTGNGNQVTFSKTLDHVPSPWSVQILIDGVPVAGDRGDGNGGKIIGPTASWITPLVPVTSDNSAASVVSYTTGDLAITFNTAPAAGATITANYVYGGFGSGTGLMDEDGSHAWVPTLDAHYVLSGGTVAMLADLEGFQTEYARQYFSSTKSVVNTFFPGVAYIGPTNMDGSAGIWQAAGEYLPVARMGLDTQTGGDTFTASWQQRVDFIHAAAPTLGLMMWVGKPAAADAYYYDDPRGNTYPAVCLGDTKDVATQAARSTWYQAIVGGLQNTRASDGVRPFVGMQFWQLYDNWLECRNWGLLTPLDNAYDGVEGVAATVPCVDVGGPDYTCGGEPRDYGAMITSDFKTANRAWMPPQAKARIQGYFSMQPAP